MNESMKTQMACEEIDKETLARLVDLEPAEIEAREKKVIRLCRCTRNLLKKKETQEFRNLPDHSQVMVRRMTVWGSELDRHERDLMLYFSTARNIQKKADKEARQIWQRVIRTDAP